MKKSILSAFIASLILFASSSSVLANEGTFELNNKVDENARCWAASVLMQDLNYSILMSCRDILYPGGTSVFSYVVWANSAQNGTAFKLGTLGLGKVSFRTKTPFNALFVTKESAENVRVPSGEVVMEGGIKSIEMLDTKPNATEKPELGDPEVTPTPKAEVKKASFNILRAGGAIAVLGIAALIGLILYITKK